MIWKFISSGINNGSYNMDFDMMLAKSLNSNEAILRLYQWKPYCISLGTNQSEGSLKLEKIITNNIDLVTFGKITVLFPISTFSNITTL